MALWTRQQLQALDAGDGLAQFRDAFHLPAGVIYLNGNSLGLLSKDAEAAVGQLMHQWRTLAIDGWFRGPLPWLPAIDKISSQVAPLVGAGPEEVTTANSTTVNLHQLLATLFRPDGRRRKILADATIFRSDLYAIRSHLQLRGLTPDEHLVLCPADDSLALSEELLIDRMQEDVALALLPSVVYHTSQLLDMQRLVAEAHRRGILIGFDCSHSVGCIPHQLSQWGADFGFWCSYKYLNGGPGAVAGMYLNRRHFDCQPGIAGWFGSRKDRLLQMPFEMDAAPGAERLQISTPPMLSVAPLLGSLSLISQATMPAIRSKSLRLTGLLMDLLDELRDPRLAMVTPRDAHRRGGHVAVVHPQAEQLCGGLRQRQVVADFRRPDMIRLAPSPLYTSFAECGAAVDKLAEALHAL